MPKRHGKPKKSTGVKHGAMKHKSPKADDMHTSRKHPKHNKGK